MPGCGCGTVAGMNLRSNGPGMVSAEALWPAATEANAATSFIAFE